MSALCQKRTSGLSPTSACEVMAMTGIDGLDLARDRVAVHDRQVNTHHQYAFAYAGSTCRSTTTGSVNANVEP